MSNGYDALAELATRAGCTEFRGALIKADGDFRHLESTPDAAEVMRLIGADCLDGFATAATPWRYVYVDDLAVSKCLPINSLATELYWTKTGGPADHYIRGDVVIVPRKSPLTEEDLL